MCILQIKTHRPIIKVLTSCLAKSGLHSCSTKGLLRGLGQIMKGLITKHLVVPHSQIQTLSMPATVLLEPVYPDYHTQSHACVQLLHHCARAWQEMFTRSHTALNINKRDGWKGVAFISSIGNTGTFPTMCWTSHFFLPNSHLPKDFPNYCTIRYSEVGLVQTLIYTK